MVSSSPETSREDSWRYGFRLRLSLAFLLRLEALEHPVAMQRLIVLAARTSPDLICSHNKIADFRLAGFVTVMLFRVSSVGLKLL